MLGDVKDFQQVMHNFFVFHGKVWTKGRRSNHDLLLQLKGLLHGNKLFKVEVDDAFR